jgi:hypothetical protein
MVQNSNYGHAGDRKAASLSIGLELLAYALKPERKADFDSFYDKNIMAWLDQNNIARANAWIVGDYLIILSSPKMRPWSGVGGIPHLDEYLLHTEPVPIHELNVFTLSPRTAKREYPASKSA